MGWSCAGVLTITSGLWSSAFSSSAPPQALALRLNQILAITSSLLDPSRDDNDQHFLKIHPSYTFQGQRQRCWFKKNIQGMIRAGFNIFLCTCGLGYAVVLWNRLFLQSQVLSPFCRLWPPRHPVLFVVCLQWFTHSSFLCVAAVSIWHLVLVSHLYESTAKWGSCPNMKKCGDSPVGSWAVLLNTSWEGGPGPTPW